MRYESFGDNELIAVLDDINQTGIRKVVDILVERHSNPPPGEDCNKQEWETKLREKWTEFFSSKDMLKDWIKAFDIINDDLHRRLSKIEYHKLQNEWKSAVKALADQMHEPKNSDVIARLPFSKPLNETCGISESTLGHFYEVGLRLYGQHQLKEAILVFRLISMLNGLKENVWISLGLCQKHLSQHALAIFSFAMAIIINSQNPLSYVNSAECYLELHERNDAKECLVSAQEIIKSEKREQCQTLKDHIRSLLKLC